MVVDNFDVNEFGEIVREQYNNTKYTETEEEKLMHEYSLLSYEIHHLTRPTKDAEKIARYEELKRILNIDEEKQKNAFNAGKEKVLAKLKEKEQSDNSWLKTAIEKRKIEGWNK